MKKKTAAKSSSSKVETITDLKQQTVKKDDVKKGYNEKNPTQPQGAFKPDNAAESN